ncbi:MAG: GYF domain-containing protein [Pirellulales bacterium]
MAREWHYAIGGERFGPIEPEELRGLAAAGRLAPDDLVWKPGLAEWVAARSVRGLFPGPVPPPLPRAAVGTVAPGGEAFLWRGRPSQMLNLPVFLLAIALCWLVIPIVLAAWRFLEIRCTGYELTSERLRRTSGVFSRVTEEIELYRVKDTRLSEPWWLRPFTLGDIELVASDVTTPRLVIRAIPIATARALRETIRGAVEGLRGRKGVREIDAT